MSDNGLEFHYVCTLEEARKIVDEHDHYWVCDCACREHRGPCKRSRMDVCLQFASKTAADGSNKNKASRTTVDRILDEAKEKHLVPRPFRNNDDQSKTDGICFCCDDCCGYFLGLHEPCDKGAMIESTNTSLCNGCGVCAEVCHFGSRTMGDNGQLVVDTERCYGCGLCVDVCPTDSIIMVNRS
ncbi:MAG TPA: 4Fe-4S binding protein [Methanocellaceae archaeon]